MTLRIRSSRGLPEQKLTDFDFSVIYPHSVPVIDGHHWFDWDNHREDWTEDSACVAPPTLCGKVVFELDAR